MHTTISINAFRNQWLEDIRSVDNLEVLESVRRAYTRAHPSFSPDQTF